MPAASRLSSPAAIVSLLVLLLGAAGLFSLQYTNTRAAAGIARLEALNHANLGAVHARADFKTQVQEWKNILLRGADPADLATHRARFEQEETSVRAGLLAIKRDFPPLDYAAAPSPDTDALLREHQRLGALYRRALAGSDLANPADVHRIDTAVRGADRRLSDELGAFAATFEKAVAAELQTVAADSAARYRTLHRLVLIVASAAILAALWLVFAASRRPRA